ncbi:MAG: cbb3-type cytochrome oxidase assembly protein CcoS [Phycisphaerales bacterium]
MEVIYVLVMLGVLLVGAAVGAFVWSVRRGDMDDLETPAMRVLFEDEAVVVRPRAAVPSDSEEVRP